MKPSPKRTKKKIIIISIILAITTLLTTHSVFKHKYDKITTQHQLTKKVITIKATNSEITTIQHIHNNWNKIHHNNETINSALDLAKYPRTINSLINLWNHTPKPYSFFNLKRNKQELTIAATKNLITETGTWKRKNNMLFRINNNFAQTYIQTPKGIYTLLHTDKTIPSHTSPRPN